MKQEQIVSFFFVGLFIFILYQLVLIFSPFMAAISWAAILTFAFYPLFEKMRKLPHSSPSLAALVVTLLVILIVVLPATFVIISLMKEAVELYYRINNYLSAGNLERFLEQIHKMITSDWMQKLWTEWTPFQTNATNLVLGGARKIANFSALQLATLTKNLIFWIFNLFLIAFLLFFFFRDGNSMYEFVYQMIPMAKRNKLALVKKINETLSAVIRGQFLTSIIQATLTGITFWILGLPLPFLFGFLTFLTSMIPITGAATVWAPFVIYLLSSRQFEKGISLLIIGALVISLIDNFLKSMFIGEKTKLPIFLLFLGILGGMKLYGLTGIFLGPVVLSLFFALTRIYREEYHTES